MKHFVLVAMLLLACSAEDPAAVGYPVVADSECHQLLLKQCTCCGDGELNCTAAINHGVESQTHVANLDNPSCVPKLQQATDDPDVFCASFGSGATLTLACYGYPPSPEDDGSK